VSPKQRGLRERSVDADQMNLSFSSSRGFQVGESVSRLLNTLTS